jgi:hypothetical protein
LLTVVLLPTPPLPDANETMATKLLRPPLHYTIRGTRQAVTERALCSMY